MLPKRNVRCWPFWGYVKREAVVYKMIKMSGMRRDGLCRYKRLQDGLAQA